MFGDFSLLFNESIKLFSSTFSTLSGESPLNLCCKGDLSLVNVLLIDLIAYGSLPNGESWDAPVVGPAGRPGPATCSCSCPGNNVPLLATCIEAIS